MVVPPPSFEGLVFPPPLNLPVFFLLPPQVPPLLLDSTYPCGIRVARFFFFKMFGLSYPDPTPHCQRFLGTRTYLGRDPVTLPLAFLPLVFIPFPLFPGRAYSTAIFTFRFLPSRREIFLPLSLNSFSVPSQKMLLLPRTFLSSLSRFFELCQPNRNSGLFPCDMRADPTAFPPSPSRKIPGSRTFWPPVFFWPTPPLDFFHIEWTSPPSAKSPHAPPSPQPFF